MGWESGEGTIDEDGKPLTASRQYNLSDEFKCYGNKNDGVITIKGVTYVCRVPVGIERITDDEEANEAIFEEQGRPEDGRIACTDKLSAFSLHASVSSGVPWRTFNGRNVSTFVT